MIMSRARCTLYVLSAALLAAAVPAVAKPYPVNVCVSRKQQDAGDYCRRVLKAWATWDRTQDAARRDNKIAVASATLGLGWAKAEAQSSNAGVDCGDTTSSAAQMTGAIDSATGAIVAAVNAGLDLGDKSNARCGGNLLQAAARKCARLLGAESDFVRNLARDQHATRRDAAKARISETFSQAYNRQRRLGCPTAATGSGLETLIDGAVARVVTDTTVSPNVSSTEFTTIPPTGTTTYLGKSLTPICMNGSPYEFFVKRGTVNKLLMYYQGGGACWDALTCSVPVCDTNVERRRQPEQRHVRVRRPQQSATTRSATGTSSSCRTAAATSTSATPRRTTATACTSSTAATTTRASSRSGRASTSSTRTRSSSPARAPARTARGSTRRCCEMVWPASQFHVLADAGNGVITQDFLQTKFPQLGLRDEHPDHDPGRDRVARPSGTGIPGYTEAVASYFPETPLGALRDGVRRRHRRPDRLLQHHAEQQRSRSRRSPGGTAAAPFNSVMRAAGAGRPSTAVPSNYRYYIGTGSRHTMWG